ncbi:murein biosynthesis integral membrane protein MurJ [Patescibacteria group bacterium]
MVKRILNILNKEYAGLHRAAYLLGIFALLSQVLALVRDRLLAHAFGAGAALDVYYAAFRVPDLIYISVASLVSVTVLIPFLAEKINPDVQKGSEEAKNFLNSVFSAFFTIIIFVAAVIFLFAPQISNIIAPGFSLEQKDELIVLMRILLLSPILLGMSSLLGSVVQVYRKFFVYASAPLLYNIGIIFGIVFLLPIFGLKGVVFGVLIGAVMHLLIQIPVVVRHGLVPRPKFAFWDKELARVAALSLPRTLALSANQITLIALIAFASLMIEGSVAVFNFSLNLQSVPLSIIGVSYSIAAFPTLARLFAVNKTDEFVSQVITAARHIIFWATPIIILFIVLRAQIVRTILGTGAFDWSDTRLVAAALAVFAISVLAQSLQLLFVRAFYAAGETKIPVIVNVLSAFLIAVLAYVFMQMFEASELLRYFMESILRIEGVPGSSIVMLPLAYSIGMIINCVVLFIYFRKRFSLPSTEIHKVFADSFSASVIMGFVAYEFLGVFGNMFDLDTFIGVFAQGLFAGLIGIAVGVLVLILLGNSEIKEVLGSVHNKVKRKPIVAPDVDEL